MNKAMEIALIQRERLGVLDEENELWMKSCKDCNLIQEAVERGELGKGTWKDRKNPICDACPHQPKLRAIGKRLDETMWLIKQLRKG